MIVGLEVGRRRCFASALDWPGWCRSGKGEEGAVEALLSYAGRYGVVVARAGLELGPLAEVEVVERVPGDATTDFGAPGAHFRYDDRPVAPGEWAAVVALMRAAWEYLDEVVAAAPAELRKGPRGGGRDRDAVVAHVLEAEVAYGRKLGLSSWKPLTATPEEVAARRQAILDLFAAGGDGAPVREGGWPLRYAARRGLWHLLDHAFEIEDRAV